MKKVNPPRRILIIRTDRVGDVLLSTPVIKNLREYYPLAYIAMMVRPYAVDIVKGNPYLNEVILYDKYGRHKSWWASLRFALELRKKQFDLALILHPTNRVHIVTFFAGIPERIGYDRKCSFILTKRIKFTKSQGDKHETEYTLDIIRALGLIPKDKSPFMPISRDCQAWALDFLKQNHMNGNQRLVAIHPGASCPSKRWPAQRFAEVADKIIERYNVKVIIISSQGQIHISRNVRESMHYPVIDASGKTSIGRLAALLKRCQLFISNDSGPVHIAASLGVPVIVIFGRNQTGLSPIRWGPQGDSHIILHKEIGCKVCLAHNCDKDFACLKAISVGEVLGAVDEINKIW